MSFTALTISVLAAYDLFSISSYILLYAGFISTVSSAVESKASVNSIANFKCSSLISSARSSVAIIPISFSIFFVEPKSSAIREIDLSLSSSFIWSYSRSFSLIFAGYLISFVLFIKYLSSFMYLSSSS